MTQKPFNDLVTREASFSFPETYDIEWEGIGLLCNYFYGWPDNIIITYSKKLGYAGGMNEKEHILVNLGQI